VSADALELKKDTAALAVNARPVGLDAPGAKRLPCTCLLSCEPLDRASQTARFVIDHTACTQGHAPRAPGALTAWCACVIRSAPAEGTRQAFVIDFSACKARGVPVPPTLTPRP